MNHTAPSGPAVIAVGSEVNASDVVDPNVPYVAREPIESVPRAVNHNAPSGPVAMPKGEEPSTGSVLVGDVPTEILQTIWRSESSR